jgi:ABC-type ATPase with predicted acetyltransferase domain
LSLRFDIKNATLYYGGERCLDLDITYKTNITNPSERVVEISDAFGVGIDETHKQIIVENLTIPNFDILYLTGMSGSGKTSLLNEFKKEYGFVEPQFDEETDEPIIDIIGKDLDQALHLLNLVGLGEAFLYVKPYKILSDGQKYRFKIAKLIESNQKVWCIDEFCSFLDRTTAYIVSYNIQKVARKLNKKVIVATAHNDLQDFLQADYVFDFNMGEGLIIEKNVNEIINPFINDIKIEEGNINDYKKLGKYHYKNTEARFTKYIFKMTYKNILVGIAVYSVPKQQLVGRNVYFNKRYINERGVPILSDVNRDIITASRYIIHPMFRGIGLGQELVRLTAPLVDKPYVEIVSTMSKYNKFLDRAGAIYVCDNLTEEKRRKQSKIIELLNQYGFQYEFISSPSYCKKILETIPEQEIKKSFYSVLRANYFNNRARFKKYNINLQTKKEFMNMELTPEMISFAKWPTTYYYIWENV